MSVTPEKELSLTLENAKILFANSATMKILMNSTTVDGAKARGCFWASVDADAQNLWPRYILNYPSNNWSWEKTSTTGGTTTSRISVIIETQPPPDYQGDANNQQRYIRWLNLVGRVLEEIKVLAVGGGGYLNVIGIDVQEIGAQDPVSNNGNEVDGVELELTVRGRL